MKLSSSTGRRTLVVALALAGLSPGWAQAPAQYLPPFVTSATRTAADPQTIGTMVDVVSAGELARRQINSLAAAFRSAFRLASSARSTSFGSTGGAAIACGRMISTCGIDGGATAIVVSR